MQVKLAPTRPPEKKPKSTGGKLKNIKCVYECNLGPFFPLNIGAFFFSCAIWDIFTCNFAKRFHFSNYMVHRDASSRGGIRSHKNVYKSLDTFCYDMHISRLNILT